MADPDDLARAAELDRLALEAIDRGELRRAVALRIAASALRGELPVTNRRDKKRQMHAVERLQVSKGKGEEEQDPLHKAANDAGFTLRSLAKQLKAEGWRCSQPYLSQCRQGSARIKESLAKRIETLTGFRATRANWPADGWAKE